MQNYRLWKMYAPTVEIDEKGITAATQKLKVCNKDMQMIRGDIL